MPARRLIGPDSGTPRPHPGLLPGTPLHGLRFDYRPGPVTSAFPRPPDPPVPVGSPAHVLSPMGSHFQDPAGVQALLDQIRSSSAWQQLSASQTQSAPELADQTPEREPPNPSVASLLSQLQAPPDPLPNAKSAERPNPPTSLPSSDPPQQVAGKDLRFTDLDEAMPILLRLSREPSFIDEVKKIKHDQDALERQLWEERRNIHKKYQDKLKAAQIKANIIGVTISKHESDMIVDAHKKEISKFDANRAVLAWDSLVSQQQLKLQRLHVPTMYVTSESSTRELQQRVLQVLISVIGPSIK